MSVTKDFIEAHYTDFFKYAVVMLKNKNDAEDAVQETVFKLLRHSLDIDGERFTPTLFHDALSLRLLRALR